MKTYDNVRVRFAPSPTGMLHIGGARTAIDNWAFAKSQNGKFILRIEDTDPKRSTEENTQIILRAMKWLELDWDEGPESEGEYGPYFQTQRMDLYKEALQYLIDHDAAYPCFCSKEIIEKKKEQSIKEHGGYNGYDRACRSIPKDEALNLIKQGKSHVWRLKVPLDHKPVIFKDEVYGKMEFPAEVMDDLILVRADGMPTYNFAVVCDDSSMEITHVVRGDDHLSNTPRQILIYEALNKPIPQFAHLSMILGPDGKKLSKRHGSTSVEEYKERGYLPDAIVNYLALLGWSLDDKTTIVKRDILCKEFSLDRISKKDSIFDETKLDWMNGYYIREMGNSKLAEYAKEWFAKAYVLGIEESKYDFKITPTPTKEEQKANSKKIKSFDKAKVENAKKFIDNNFDLCEKICPLIIERLNRLDEIPEKISFLFWKDSLILDEKSKNKILCKKNNNAKRALRLCKSVFENEQNNWDWNTLQTKCQHLCKEYDFKPRNLFQPLRVAVCGNMVSPPLFECIELIDRQHIISRVNKAIEIATN